MKKNIAFITKVTIAHLITYIVCGLIFSNLFNYGELFKLGNAQYFMRDAFGLSSLAGPAIQIIRGILLGSILILVKDSFLDKPLGWLRLWAVVAGIGIICTPAPAPVSIEGIVYSQLPLEFHIKIAPELFAQTLLFSVWVTSNKRLKISEKVKRPLIVTAIAGGMFSLCGIVLALVLKVDFMKSATDIGAFAVMFCSLAVVFWVTKGYLASGIRPIVYYPVCYLALAVFPTVYNYVSDSLLKSPVSLVISGFPLLGIWLYHKFAGNKTERI